jgi:hypothetical protein
LFDVAASLSGNIKVNQLTVPSAAGIRRTIAWMSIAKAASTAAVRHDLGSSCTIGRIFSDYATTA